MTKTAADVEVEVEAQRGQLDRTVEAIKEKMTPGNLFDEATHAMGGAGQELLSKLIDKAMENPMPVAVTGVGLAWLMAGSGKSAGAAKSATEKTPSLSTNTRHHGDPAREMLHDMQGKATDMMSDAQEKLAEAMASASDMGQAAQRGISDIFTREPLLLGALGIAIGIAVGATLPSTDEEDHLVGRVRDKVVEKGKTMAHDGVEAATDAVQAAYGAVKSELQNPANADAALADRARAAGAAGAHAVRETVGATGTGA